MEIEMNSNHVGKDELPLVSQRDELLQSIGRMTADKSLQGPFIASHINPCIYRVPEILRNLKRSAYSPRSVSIGPLHRGKRNLKGMEEHKMTYMHHLFSRIKESINETNEVVAPQIMEVCVDAMLKDAEQAQSHYAVSLKSYSPVQFAEMMLVDGCFILELLYRSCLWKNDSLEFSSDDSRRGDPFFGNDLVLNCLRHDLLLLENQIPFFVLQKLFDLVLKPVLVFPASSLIALVHKFFETSMMTFESVDNRRKDVKKPDHILDLLHKFYKPSVTAHSGKFTDVIKHSATELDRAGVNFKTCKKDSREFNFVTSCCFYWLGACRNCSCLTLPSSTHNTKSTSSSSCCFFSWFCHLCGTVTIEIPKLCVFDSTETLLRNLIAFEQCSPCIPHYITSYAYLMDTLINTDEDVAFLEREGVLQNHLGSSKEATDLFNNICNEVVLVNFFYFSQWEDLEKYYKRAWPRNLAYLRRTYFSSPWSGISVFAALVLFTLTVIQTIYTIRAV